MNNQERIKKYKREHCTRCKNKNKFDCEIRIFTNNNIVCTKCVFYEREINFIKCMKKKCEQCKNYNICFNYNPKGRKNKKNFTKSMEEMQ